jgi:hypothetical protein
MAAYLLRGTRSTIIEEFLNTAFIGGQPELKVKVNYRKRIRQDEGEVFIELEVD